MFKRFSIVLLMVLLSVIVLPILAIGEDTTSISGQLVYIGEDFNVYTYDFSTDTTTALTDDATTTRRYQWPTWSSDGRIAYFCCDLRATNDTDAEIFIARDGFTRGELVYEQASNAVIYAYWSPANCSADSNCRDLALLMNNVAQGGLSIEMIRHQDTATTNRTIDTGSPFYYHWNPTGTQLIFHRFGRQLDIYDIGLSDVATSFDQPSSGLFQAPAWSPVDDRILFGLQGESRGGSNLVISEGSNLTTIVENVRGLVSFLWSPNGEYIAYRTFTRDGISSVIVVDTNTGAEVSRSVLSDVIAFFWSPDSSKVAYLTLPDGAQQIAWSVLDLSLGTDTAYAEFVPTYEMGYVLQYFDQFSPSHHVWSPDSRYLVYSERVEADGGFMPQVSIIDVNQPDSHLKIAEGSLGIWSFE